MARVLTRSFTQRFSLSTQKRRVCRFGSKRRLVFRFEWDTLFPTMGRFPVTSQTLDTVSLLKLSSIECGAMLLALLLRVGHFLFDKLDVLLRNWVELFQRELVRHRSLVLGGVVAIAGAGG